VRGRAKEGTRARIALAIIALVAVVALALAPLLSPVDVTEGGGRGQGGRWSQVGEH